jgi:hypothetical protein
MDVQLSVRSLKNDYKSFDMNIDNPTPTPHLPMYLLTHPFINLPTCLPTKSNHLFITCLPTYLPTHPPAYLLPIYLLLIYLPTHPLTYLPTITYPPTHLLTHPHMTHLLTYLPFISYFL